MSKLLASSGTPDGLSGVVSRYLGGEKGITLSPDGRILHSNGTALSGFRWVKKGGRYRFEVK